MSYTCFLHRPITCNLGSLIGRTYRLASSSVPSSGPDYYRLFPKTFPRGAPPSSPFMIEDRKLRKEYRKLQALNHPDLINRLNQNGGSEVTHTSSSLINKAYDTINDPLKRSQYLLNLNANIDLTSDEATHKYEFADQDTLMRILEIHENLEEMTNQKEAEKFRRENQIRINESIEKLDILYSKKDYEAIAMETIRLKYWYNIKNVLKDWLPGKPINLTH
ncbi:hypothetical protein FOA43_000925 [Brettanomyces nanus]|uniref:J domain-containing protein n=1 Tax=Eeniella nana TaxID=13502 RepID=A0A875RYC4_EENNA|nr:uncharacterized protein FOA43_000925 [Brettanomyces nanus]QPG73613.1 hypothetical protein FOA43_000925 [Brettanomyces nanus]